MTQTKFTFLATAIIIVIGGFFVLLHYYGQASMLKQPWILVMIFMFIILALLVNNTRLYRNTMLLHKIKEVDRMKDEFISMASHELRAPITGIRGYISMLLDGTFGQLPAEAQTKLHMVHEETERLHTLVEDLLEVSRIEQGRISIQHVPVAVGAMVQEIARSFIAQAADKGLDLNVVVQPDLPPARADTSRLQQIIVNLLSNAVKYTMNGTVTIAAEEARDTQPMIRITVSDTGIGISEKNRERLFQKFYRVRSKETDTIVGTGLGLWITKQLVELMNGSISLESTEHVGTHVTILLPVAQTTKS